MNAKLIEQRRQALKGGISEEDDLIWEAYLQLHAMAEDMEVLAQDADLHALLDSRLGAMEVKYDVR